MDDVACILHIGAPKCGSSALQTALTAQPEMRDGAGRRYRYIVYRATDGGGALFTGQTAKMASRHSLYGYASWPNVGGLQDPDAFWSAMNRVRGDARRKGMIPILSNEGWIAHAEAFAGHLRAAPGRTEAIAFVRPPLDWLNAAYWQWGVWSGLDFATWLSRTGSGYQLGAQIEAWSRLPGLGLTVRSARRDVIGAFAERFGLPLAGDVVSNSSAPPALIGFLLRNRRFRPSAHESGVEFVFGRWCRMTRPERPWAITLQEAERILQDSAADVDRLAAAIAPADAEVLLADPSWSGLDPYRARLEAAPTPLDDREALADLHAAVAAGLEACCARARIRPPAVPPLPAASRPIADWDRVIAKALAVLIEVDETARLGRAGRSRAGRMATAAYARLTGRRASGSETRAMGQGYLRLLSAPGRDETAIAGLFGGKVRFEGTEPVCDRPLVLIAFTEGSGVALLADHLRRTGAVGGTGAFLDRDAIARLRQQHSAPHLPDLLSALAGRHCSDDRHLFGILVRWDHIAMLHRWNLLAMFPEVRVIHILREDTVAQAAACDIARQVRSGSGPGREPVFREEEIERLIASLRLENDLIALQVQALDLPRVQISHEQLRSRPGLHVQRVLSFCGVDLPDWRPRPTPLAGPDNPTSSIFAGRYRDRLRAAME